MRLLLDAHLSPKRVGAVPTGNGHDVLSLAADATLGALDDPEVLALAAEQDRIVITRNARDFAPLQREWAETGRHHCGCILVRTIEHHEFGRIVATVERLLTDRPEAEQWVDLAIAI